MQPSLCTTSGIDALTTLELKHTPFANISFATTCFAVDNKISWQHRLLFDDQRLHHLADNAEGNDQQQLAFAYDIMMMAHEIRHVIGLQHEHQRPDAYDVYNKKDASLVLLLENLENYDVALHDTMTGKASEDATLSGLPLGRQSSKRDTISESAFHS